MSYLPRGCDQQGRYPQAAEPCTDLGVEDEMEASFAAAMLLVAACFLVALLLAWLV